MATVLVLVLVVVVGADVRADQLVRLPSAARA